MDCIAANLFLNAMTAHETRPINLHLYRLATLLLCQDFHQDQADEIVRQWTAKIQESMQKEKDQTVHKKLELELQAGHKYLQAEHAELQEERTVLQAGHAKLQAERTVLQAEHAKLQAERTVLQAGYTELQTGHAQLQAEHAELKAEHAKLQAEHAKLQAEHAEFQAGHAEFQAEHVEFQAEHAELQADYAALNNKFETLRKNQAESKNKLGALSQILRYTKVPDLNNLWPFTGVERFVVRSNALKSRWRQLDRVMHPDHDVCSIIPASAVTYAMDNNRVVKFTPWTMVTHPGLIDRMKNNLEKWIGNPIIWWPLQPPRARCANGHTRISWSCVG
jgi:predicted nuclease with TOPRIM domain